MFRAVGAYLRHYIHFNKSLVGGRENYAKLPAGMFGRKTANHICIINRR